MSLRDPVTRYVLLAILTVALALRLLGAWRGNLMYDESTHSAAAATIDLRPASFNFVWRSVDHPLMSGYVVRFSGVVFGDTLLGLRILYVLFGVGGVFAIYLLGTVVFSSRVGLWAAALLAVDQFHLTWSYFVVPEILLLFFATIVLLIFFRVARTRRLRDFVLLGVAWGLAYLAKETGFVLVPILWLCVLATPGLRSILRNRGWYVAHAVALLVVMPDLVWGLTHWYEGYLYRDVGLISEASTLSPRVLLLYLGELMQHITGPLGGFTSNYETQNPQMAHSPSGLVYLVATVAAFRFRPIPRRVSF